LEPIGSVTDIIHAKYTFGLPEQAIALIMRDVLNALEYLHAKNFVHRCVIFTVYKSGFFKTYFFRSVRASHVYIGDERACLGGARHAINTSCLSNRQHYQQNKNRLFTLDESMRHSLLWLAPELLRQVGLLSRAFSVLTL
jgi:hypothetical protein